MVIVFQIAAISAIFATAVYFLEQIRRRHQPANPPKETEDFLAQSATSYISNLNPMAPLNIQWDENIQWDDELIRRALSLTSGTQIVEAEELLMEPRNRVQTVRIKKSSATRRTKPAVPRETISQGIAQQDLAQVDPNKFANA